MPNPAIFRWIIVAAAGLLGCIATAVCSKPLTRPKTRLQELSA